MENDIDNMSLKDLMISNRISEKSFTRYKKQIQRKNLGSNKSMTNLKSKNKSIL